MVKLLFSFLSLLPVLALAQQPICDFAIKMYTVDVSNDCFDGWSMKQTEELAGPLLTSWQESQYPETIDIQDECTSLVTLTQAQYDAKANVEKSAYRESQERCGYNLGFDKTYAYCFDDGYRNGWEFEYTNKTNNMNPDYEPIGEPSLILPDEPTPRPETYTYEGEMHWFKTKYLAGWNKGCSDGFFHGRKEGLAAGLLAREQGDDYQFAYAAGYKRGFNDATLDLVKVHVHPGNGRNRKLRSGGHVERKMREQYSTGYSEGYNEAIEDREARQLASAERELAKRSRTCTQQCIAHHNGDTTLNTQQWNTCKWIKKACSNIRRLEETEWSYVDTLPVDGVQAGTDFKRLIAHLVSQSCSIDLVKFELWKSCPN